MSGVDIKTKGRSVVPVDVDMEQAVKRQARGKATQPRTMSNCTPETVVQYDGGLCLVESKGRKELACWAQGAVSKGSTSELQEKQNNSTVLYKWRADQRQPRLLVCPAVHRPGRCRSAASVSRRQMTRHALQRPIDAAAFPEDWTCLFLQLQLQLHSTGPEMERRRKGCRPQPAPTEAAARSCRFAAWASRQTNNQLHWTTDHNIM